MTGIPLATPLLAHKTRDFAHAHDVFCPRVCAMDYSSEEEAVTLKSKDVVKLKETVEAFQSVLGGISKDPRERESQVPGLSGLSRGRASHVFPGPSALSSSGASGEWKKGW